MTNKKTEEKNDQDHFPRAAWNQTSFTEMNEE